MFARSRASVHIRQETFGVSAYVADRDDIFLLDRRESLLLANFSGRWKSVPPEDQIAAEKLAHVGLLDVRNEGATREIAQRSYCGVHLLGDFADVPLVVNPLIVNCFSTAWCPLQCVYCHADDLMGEDARSRESISGADGVAETASRLRSLVYVITGGDPLTRPERAARLVEGISDESGFVIDTSGVGNIAEAIRLLRIRPMHLRVSIDSMDPRINKKTRPTNPKLRSDLGIGTEDSLNMASRLIEEAGQFASGVTVQTVISSKNDKVEHLFQFRDWLISRGVRNWVLHTAVNAGAARRFSIRRTPEPAAHSLPIKKATTILPDRVEASRAMKLLIESTMASDLPIDIRCTDANTAPNSVFLVGSDGALYTQGRGPEGGRKVKLFDAGHAPGDASGFWTYISCLDHVQRYINYVPLVHGSKPVSFKLRT